MLRIRKVSTESAWLQRPRLEFSSFLRGLRGLRLSPRFALRLFSSIRSKLRLYLHSKQKDREIKAVVKKVEAGSPASEEARGCKRGSDLRTQPAVLSRQLSPEAEGRAAEGRR